MSAGISPARGPWSVALREGCKRYGRDLLFRGLSLELGPGTVLRVSGPNGSGKTQLLLALCGLTELDLGKVVLDDLPKRGKGIPPHRRDRYLRFIAAFPTPLNELGVAEFTFAMARSLRPFVLRSRALGVAQHFERHGAALAAAVGVRLDPNRPVNQFSIGQQKRLQLAAHIFTDCPAWVLAIDEPLAALDGAGINAMLSLIRQARDRGTALVIAEHHAEIDAIGFDEVVQLPFGRRGADTVLALAPRSSATVATDERCLEVYGARIGYPGRELQCERLAVNRGGVAVICGDNGAGKTGMLKGLLGAAPATAAGVIRLCGSGVANLAGGVRKGEVRYMTQARDNFMDLRVGDAFHAAAAPACPHDPLLSGLAAKLGLGKRVRELSAGQRALLALAQTLAGRPILAFLDEPFANVDADNQQLMLEALDHASSNFGTAFLLVAHGVIDFPGASRYVIREGACGHYIEHSLRA